MSDFIEHITLEKFVHGGQALATDGDGKKMLVWGGLPGEVVDVQIIKKKRSFREAVVVNVLESSPDRVEPLEPEVYLSTSPWQIVNPTAEPLYKQAILQETFAREGVAVSWDEFQSDDRTYGYRNKMEFGFWGDESGINLAHYIRGSHGKRSTPNGSKLAVEPVNEGAKAVIKMINTYATQIGLRAGDLKTVIVRSNQKGEVVAALFIRSPEILINDDNFVAPTYLKGLDVYFSNPKSPASLPTKKMYTYGNTTLVDAICGVNISYGVLSFFQVNLPMFERVLERIDDFGSGMPKVDMYSGVGAIGIPIDGVEALVESDIQNIKMAQKNVGNKSIQVVHAESEKALDYIYHDKSLIVDPPRAGLHAAVVHQILDVVPPQIIYLSCNPSTQARDIKLLSEKYRIASAQGYNFFPRTPHIESLILLERL